MYEWCFKINSGIDTNANNVLDPDEILEINYICNGSNGQDGEDGNDGHNILTNITETSNLNECENGGFIFEFGIDTNSNQILEGDEIISKSTVCNGLNGLNSLINITKEKSGENCDLGGYKIETGIDLNLDKLLNINEITSTKYLCTVNNIPPSSIAMNYNIEMIGTYGQSLAVGGDASNSLTDFQNTVTFIGGSSLYNRNFTTQEDKNAFFGENFIFLENNNANEQYPPATASVTSILNLIKTENNITIEALNYSLMPLTGGVSGASITSMNKGTTAYQNYLECILKAKEFSNKEGKTFAVRAINWVQGESDKNKTKTLYYKLLSELFIDFNKDIKAITNQEEDVKFITYQTSPRLGVNLNGVISHQLNIQKAQVQVANDFDNVFLSGAMYQFSYSDAYHPIDRAVVGLQQGIANKRLIHDEKNWVTFQPISHKIISDGSKYYIHLKFDVPVAPLRFDISGDAWHNPNGKQKNFGFQLLKCNLEKLIDEPYITLGNTIVLTTDENPLNMKISYAVNGHYGGGNLCDSQNITIKNKGIDYVVDNFAVAFSEYLIE